MYMYSRPQSDICAATRTRARMTRLRPFPFFRDRLSPRKCPGAFFLFVQCTDVRECAFPREVDTRSRTLDPNFSLVCTMIGNGDQSPRTLGARSRHLSSN